MFKTRPRLKLSGALSKCGYAQNQTHFHSSPLTRSFSALSLYLSLYLSLSLYSYWVIEWLLEATQPDLTFGSLSLKRVVPPFYPTHKIYSPIFFHCQNRLRKGRVSKEKNVIVTAYVFLDAFMLVWVCVSA